MSLWSFFALAFASAAFRLCAADVEWSLGRNAAREGDVVVVDTRGTRSGGAAQSDRRRTRDDSSARKGNRET